MIFFYQSCVSEKYPVPFSERVCLHLPGKYLPENNQPERQLPEFFF